LGAWTAASDTTAPSFGGVGKPGVGAASTAAFSGLGLLAMEVVAKPRAGLPAGFFFFAMVDKAYSSDFWRMRSSEMSETGRNSGGLPYGVNRSLILY
jgi:hypothetical protein